MEAWKSAWLSVALTQTGHRLLHDRHYTTVAKAVFRLVFNLFFALYNGILGYLTHSLLFTVSAVYYLLLGMMRFLAVIPPKRRTDAGTEKGTVPIGMMLIALSIVFSVTVAVSMHRQSATRYGTVTMITVATFTFTKIATAIGSAVKHRADKHRLLRALHRIRYAEIAVSLLTMQQSMLVSFGSGSAPYAVILNACTGGGVCAFILALGVLTLINNHERIETMAKSKLIKASETIADTAVGGDKAVEKTVVGTYKKIETGVVGTYTKLEDKFVDQYLTKDGETVEEAKKRLKNK